MGPQAAAFVHLQNRTLSRGVLQLGEALSRRREYLQVHLHLLHGSLVLCLGQLSVQICKSTEPHVTTGIKMGKNAFY